VQCMGAMLVLDHDRTSVELISASLSDVGYVVRTTFASAAPRTAIRAQPPALFLLDAALPVLTMTAVLEQTGGSISDVPVIITTTSPINAAGRVARDGGECLLKAVPTR
jgi:DNA-binding response OmpR family regulator